MEKVSIVIPNYNQVKYLPACIDSCYFQTYPNIELIIVDGGSTDGTKEYLAGLEQRIESEKVAPVLYMDGNGEIVYKECLAYHEDTHAEHPKREIKIFSFRENLGRTRSYNVGFKEVTGRYCTYVVGDDIAHPHMIEELVSAIEASNADVVYSDFNIVDDTGHILRLVRKPDYDFEECLAKWFHLGVSRLHRSSWFKKVGFMDEDFRVANDYSFFLKMAKAGATFHHVARVLYSVRFHGAETDLEESKKLALEARRFICSGGRKEEQLHLNGV
ncbi:MAG: glycosyltransferase [Deltaproteobacteria bacterium]|nr:glycosyltransferase [Deltaproteobacteria bacterium]MBW2122969.1 glycosyltransferase [Deltaproteobacteria bacterium]